MSKSNNKVFYCNVGLAIDIIGGKWKPLIIYHMGRNQVIRFGELKRLIPNISESVLTRQLRELEVNKVINRKDYHENPPKVEYSLTKEAEDLTPIIIELSDWAKRYNGHHNYGEIDYVDNYDDDC